MSNARLAADRLYLDHAAPPPMLPQARAAMVAALDSWANPSSPHADGRAARAALEDARGRIADALGWSGHVIFTSGASEAIAIALTRAKTGRIVTSPVEHDAVLRVTEGAERLKVDANGLILHGRPGECGAPASFSPQQEQGDASSNRPDGARSLMAIQHVNNETGVIQPLDQVDREGAILFADCAQSAGKLPLPDADMIAISVHKFGGPPGVGALLIRDLGLIAPSGGQEQGYRAGDVYHTANGSQPTIASYRMPGVPARAQLIQFDLQGISVSAGSACSSGSLKTSHVLGAMGWDEAAAAQVVRVSFGPGTGMADVERFLTAWTDMARRARR